MVRSFVTSCFSLVGLLTAKLNERKLESHVPTRGGRPKAPLKCDSMKSSSSADTQVVKAPAVELRNKMQSVRRQMSGLLDDLDDASNLNMRSVPSRIVSCSDISIKATAARRHSSLTAGRLAVSTSHSKSGAAEEPHSLNFTWDADTQMLALKVALKCSDLGHLTSQTEVHHAWVSRLEEEMFLQGDLERVSGLQGGVSPLMDRTKGGITRSQCGFFNVVAMPMFSVFAHVFPASTEMLSNLQTNLAMWKDVESTNISSVALKGLDNA